MTDNHSSVPAKRRQGATKRQSPKRSDAQAAIEGDDVTEAGDRNPPDLRSDAKPELNNADATPGTGILPELDDDDPNMASSG